MYKYVNTWSLVRVFYFWIIYHQTWSSFKDFGHVWAEFIHKEHNTAQNFLLDLSQNINYDSQSLMVITLKFVSLFALLKVPCGCSKKEDVLRFLIIVIDLLNLEMARNTHMTRSFTTFKKTYSWLESIIL